MKRINFNSFSKLKPHNNKQSRVSLRGRGALNQKSAINFQYRKWKLIINDKCKYRYTHVKNQESCSRNNICEFLETETIENDDDCMAM